VFDASKESIAGGGVDEIVPLQDVARRVLANVGSMSKRTVRV